MVGCKLMSKTILLVEDEKDLATVVTKRLKDAGYHVVHAPDGLSSYDALMQHKIDLVILDLMLPGGGGLSILNKIRMTSTLSSVPVIVLTGMHNEDYKKMITGLKVDAYFQKPYDAALLIESIKKFI